MGRRWISVKQSFTASTCGPVRPRSPARTWTNHGVRAGGQWASQAGAVHSGSRPEKAMSRFQDGASAGTACSARRRDRGTPAAALRGSTERRIRPPPRRSRAIGRSLARGPTCGSQARQGLTRHGPAGSGGWDRPASISASALERKASLQFVPGSTGARVQSGCPPSARRRKLARSTRRWPARSRTVQSGQGVRRRPAPARSHPPLPGAGGGLPRGDRWGRQALRDFTDQTCVAVYFRTARRLR